MDGRYMRLERLRATDHGADLYAACRGHDGIWACMRSGPFPDEAGFQDWLEEQERGWDPYFYAIRDRRVDRLGGLCALARSDPQNGVTEIGFILIAPVLQRTPAVIEAISPPIGWAFAHGYRRAEWKCDALNAALMAAARRYGFTYQGSFRQHMV